MPTRAKSIKWLGDTKEELSGFPLAVRSVVGYALYLAEIGELHKSVKALRGELAGVDEIVVDGGDADTYRMLYMARLGDVIYALDAFKKKSTKGKNLAKRDLQRIKARLKTARAHARGSHGNESSDHIG
ncbi:MAG TPA: type II toxin-antitoxin system RelE/ParE family toxin [Candidatus Elarobacter sp.]|jgi:phage-related protein|nr:type II toxin-antitoxin system RelE/ParE family toxin [Candidatus Elarobacter sp.]